MPNTDTFQVAPDYFPSKDEGKACVRHNTNPRYKFFRQTHFTAGDYEQFLTYWDKTSHTRRYDLRHTENMPTQVACPLYRDISSEHVIQTFEYIFHKFKKGIFVKIVENELRVFLPFSKIDFINEWSDRIRVDPVRFPKGILSMIGESAEATGFGSNPSVHYMMDHWYANNGLLRYEFPISENDSGIGAIRDMFLALTRERRVPDVEFFINKRDFPILRNDGMEAYECIFGDDHPMVSHGFSKYCPILSMTTTDRHADVPIPTWDDWSRVSYPSKRFGKDFNEYPDPFVGSYRTKKDTAVFRGASTGLGTTIETNPRLRFAAASLRGRADDDNIPFLDCGITKWNCRPRRCRASDYYDYIHQDLINQIPLVPTMTYQEQATHKFILHLPGHSEAYRLGMELGMGSVILLYPCRYKLWYSHLLVPYVHYVPVQEDVDDVIEKIRWCKQHVDDCEKIAHNAREFYETVLSRNGLLDHVSDVLCHVQKQTGLLQYPQKSMTEFQTHTQSAHLKLEAQILSTVRSFPTIDTTQDMTRLHPKTFQIILHRIDPHVIIDLIENAPVLKKSRSMILRKISVGGRALCCKTPLHPREDHIIHECFVGQMGLNRYANICPMITYTFGRWGDHVLTDFVEGDTLELSLHKQSFPNIVTFFLEILVQLSVLLQFLQREIGFIHFDLYPWNIIIRENTQRHTFSFPIDTNKNITFTPRFFPVLIDFGKSHVVYQNMHFVMIEPFHLHLHQDIFSILISGLFILIQYHKLKHADIVRVIKLINYISKTSYTRFCAFETLHQIKAFLRVKKKYSNMLMNDKSEFHRVEPIQFFQYLTTHFHIDMSTHSPSTNDFILSSEVHFSRFYCIHEACSVFNIDRSICDPLAIFWDDHDPLKCQTSSNSIHNLFKMYMDHVMLSTVFHPQRDDPNALIHMMKTHLDSIKHRVNIRYKKHPDVEHVSLPRFFSHPDMKVIGSIIREQDQNHFFERHKMLQILQHATQHHPELDVFQEFLTSATARYFMSSIIVSNLVSSGRNHIFRYQHYLS
jgi:hypothetical protein